MASVYPFAPATPTVRKLWSEVRKARKNHVLKCGCTVKPGMLYVSSGILLNGQFTVVKQHTIGCLEVIHRPN